MAQPKRTIFFEIPLQVKRLTEGYEKLNLMAFCVHSFYTKISRKSRKNGKKILHKQKTSEQKLFCFGKELSELRKRLAAIDFQFSGGGGPILL